MENLQLTTAVYKVIYIHQTDLRGLSITNLR